MLLFSSVLHVATSIISLTCNNSLPSVVNKESPLFFSYETASKSIFLVSNPPYYNTPNSKSLYLDKCNLCLFENTQIPNRTVLLVCHCWRFWARIRGYIPTTISRVLQGSSYAAARKSVRSHLTALLWILFCFDSTTRFIPRTDIPRLLASKQSFLPRRGHIREVIRGQRLLFANLVHISTPVSILTA